MVPTAERITTRIKRTTPVWMEAIVRHVLWPSARKFMVIPYPRSPSLKCTFHARHAMARNQQTWQELAAKRTLRTTPVWAKLRTLAQFDGDLTHHSVLVTPLTGSGDGGRVSRSSRRGREIVE